MDILICVTVVQRPVSLFYSVAKQTVKQKMVVMTMKTTKTKKKTQIAR